MWYPNITLDTPSNEITSRLLSLLSLLTIGAVLIKILRLNQVEDYRSPRNKDFQ